ncbi:MAG: GntR family transcriptional regulator [Roseobacter sp.]|jgi:DNA-binding GntR family transcriptional regulator|nr:GntR family transcriptional regulator [Roseobacter sp.]
MLKNSSHDTGAQAVKRPAHQAVYEDLRDQILFGQLTPGQAVTIQGLTEQLGAGMTPVREAIRRLISEGALRMMGNRRVIVPELTLDCIEELDFMRKSLEPHLARRAVERITQADLELLTAIDESLNHAIEMGDIPTYLRQNYQFHVMVYRIASAPIVAATIDRLWLRFGPSLRVVCGRHGTLNLPDKHADLIDAFQSRDAVAAGNAMSGDVDQGMNQIRETLMPDPAGY